MNNKIRQQRCAISPVPGLKLIPVSLGGTIVAVTGGGGLSDASLVRAPRSAAASWSASERKKTRVIKRRVEPAPLNDSSQP
jgi:hypothetical protein